MKTTIILVLTICALIPQSGYADDVEIIVTPNPGNLIGGSHHLHDQDNASVKYWNVGYVYISDFENYSYTVIKNGKKLDDITHKNNAIFYTGNYTIQVFNRETNVLVSTAHFSSQELLNAWQLMLLIVALFATVIGGYMLKGWIDNERLVRQRGWRHP
jgi:hypothetical protein